jgi:hypothetical protein
MIYHIRKQMTPKGGNQYRLGNNAARKVETFCGGEPTTFDVRCGDKAVAWDGHEPCSDCVTARASDREDVSRE